jgi:ribose/xylose/arabinose/galactoside ABC-type transport system permease subunit
MSSDFLRRASGREAGTLAGLVVLSGLLSVLSPYFFTLSNLVNIVQQTSIIAIIAAGMTIVIISGGIDLSVGSVVAVAGLVSADLLHADCPVSLAILTALGVGIAIGALNGILITVGHLPPFIATLGTMSAGRGLALLYSDGAPISGFAPDFRLLASGQAAGIPAPVVIMLVVFAIGHVLLTKTRLGRYAYAIGGNENAAVLCGIRVSLHKTQVYALCGMLSALASVLLTARLNSAQPVAGSMYELDAIAAAVIGGTSLLGGEGTMLGALIGALIMGVLRNGLNLLNVSTYLQQVAIGSVIIIAVFTDMTLKRRRRASRRGKQ